MTTLPSPPLLCLEGARIDAPGEGPLAEDLTGEAAGPRVGLVGAWAPLFRALSREARVVAGRAEVLGLPAEQAVGRGLLGVALASAPLPPGWRGSDYVLESARLAGMGRGARAAAQAALARLGLERMARRPVRALSPVERRALLIAHAIVNDPPALAVEDPLDDLEPGAAASLRVVLDRASLGRHLVVSSRAAPAETVAAALLESCGELLVRGPRGEVTPSTLGALPARGGKRWSVSVLDGAARLATALVDRGITLEEERLLDERALALAAISAGPNPAPDEVAAAAGLPREPGGRLVVRATTSDGVDAVVRIAHEVGAPIVELLPLGAEPDELAGPARAPHPR